MITIEKIKKAGEMLDKLTPLATPVLVFTANEWKNDKDFGWTDEELEKARTTNAFIGHRLGVDCYLSYCILDPDAEVEITIK